MALKRKILIVLFGTFFAVCILEIGLAALCFSCSFIQELHNRKPLFQKNMCTILCLGESTTARIGSGAYTDQLESILYQSAPGIKFKVINKGLSGIDSSYILAHLEENLDKYKPDIVIAMMGVNDDGTIKYYEGIQDSSILFKYSRTYRLLKTLWKQALNKAFNDEPKTAQECLSKGVLYESKGDYVNAERLLKKAIEMDPRDSQAYIKLGFVYIVMGNYSSAYDYFNRIRRFDPANPYSYIGLGEACKIKEDILKAYFYFKKSIKIYPSSKAFIDLGSLYTGLTSKLHIAETCFKKAIELNPKDWGAYLALGFVLRSENKTQASMEAFERGIEAEPYQRNYLSYRELSWMYISQKRYADAEIILKKYADLFPEDDRAPSALANLYQMSGNKDKACEFEQKAKELRLKKENLSTLTVYNYHKLKGILDKKGIKLVCVQYPMLNAEVLKRIFAGQNRILFVDNENIFKEAVGRDGYNKYFLDMFAGYFGHCTKEGNTLLAKNIANVIMKEFRHENDANVKKN